MKKIRYVFTVLFLLLPFVTSGILLGNYSGYWQQFVHYRMNVFLDPEEHLLAGESEITYVNHSPDTLDCICLHLYPNAFQEGSVKHREYQRAHYSGGISKDNPSYIDIKHFKVYSATDDTSAEFNVDDTILKAPLSFLIFPGDTITIKIVWDHKIRKSLGRAGYTGDQYDMAQWYPKIVVYDEKGWHDIPFHAIGEFYGEFGTFDVTIDVPARYVVGATGVVVSGDPGWELVAVDTSVAFSEWIDGRDSITVDTTARREVTFHAENVHDFAWVTSPKLVYEHGEWRDIDVHVLYNLSVGEKWTKVVRERSERALEWLSTKFGFYPYPQVTITQSLRGGGMEYPMLVMNGSESEGLILHEIGHIWFYGILANNEVDEAWLDEGFTTFQTRWYLETRYPPYGIDFDHSHHTNFQEIFWSFSSRSDRDQWRAIDLMTRSHNRPIATISYLSEGYNVYRQNAYTKASLMLQSLQYVLGKETFDKVMQTYFTRWKLKHVNEKQFRDVAKEVSGQDLDWFFDQWLHKSFYTDYALKKWTKKQLTDGNYEVTLDIVNRGMMQYPLDIDIVLENGDYFRTRWNNFLYRWKDEFKFTVPMEPKKIILDPDNQTLDIDLTNNYSGLPPHRICFDWPGMNYNPRSAYVVRWRPVLQYHEKDGFKPGIYLNRMYGPWSKLSVIVTAGIKSGNVKGDVRYSNSLRTISPSLRYAISGYNLEGVRGGGVNIGYTWSRWYEYPPTHSVNVGFYITDAFDTLYTDLFEEGATIVLYTEYGMSAHLGKFGGEWTFSLSSAPAGISDWSFGRLTSKLNLHTEIAGFRIASRTFGGTMSHNQEGIPGQEKFTIQGAGAGDWFAKPYLRHPSSFYGVETLRNHFHLYGDANLRGYYNHSFEGAEKVVTQIVEVTRKLPIPTINLKGRLFFDVGMVWSKADQLKGDVLMDGGFGFSLHKNIQGFDLKLRIDFPIWLNYTDVDTDTIKAINFNRWLFGFDLGL